jgi:hypothetical protein
MYRSRDGPDMGIASSAKHDTCGTVHTSQMGGYNTGTTVATSRPKSLDRDSTIMYVLRQESTGDAPVMLWWIIAQKKKS